MKTHRMNPRERASLGLAVLDRMPVAFLEDQDRPHWFNLTKYLPPRMSLEEAGAAVRRFTRTRSRSR